MDDELIRAVMALARRLLTQAKQDDGLRADLRSLAEAVLLVNEGPSSHPLTPASDGQISDAGATIRPAPELHPSVKGETSSVTASVREDAHPVPSLPELTLGMPRTNEAGSLPEPPVSTKKASITDDAELSAIEARCRLKADAMRWAANRRRLKDQGADFRREIYPKDREIIERAKKLGCYAWMSRPEYVIPKELARVEDVAACFDSVSEAVSLVRRMLTARQANRDLFEHALDVLAEAQSALRLSIGRIGGPIDQEQTRTYEWLRGVAEREQIHLPRHMTLDDPADPALRPEIEARIKDLDARFREVEGRAKKKHSALKRLVYHAGLIGDGDGSEHHWRKAAGAIEELIGDGVPASNVEVRDVLLPIIDAMPDLEDLPKEFALVLREIDRYLASRPSPGEVVADERPTREVAEAARLLAGRSVVLIGGCRRPGSCEALKSALGLGEVIWIGTREHESIDRFEPAVARREVALVLLAIRWSSHSFEGVKKFCDRNGKPMVRLPGGYNPNQVATQIIAQCSRRLDRGEGSSEMEAA
jgi:hypothetical protein